MSAHFFQRFFPVPKMLAMPGGGIEISENTVKYFRFQSAHRSRSIGAWGVRPLPDGTVVAGEIRNADALVRVLMDIRDACGFSFVHASLPEQKGYLFDLMLPRESKIPMAERVAVAMPQYVPLSPAEAVFDCESIPSESNASSRSLVITVLPETIASSYAEAFAAAGFFTLSFELEPQAAARSIFYHAPPEHEAALLVDWGSGKTVIAIVQNGLVRFTLSGEGTAATDAALAAELPQGKSIEEIKFEEGLVPGTKTRERLSPAVEALIVSIERVRTYWHSKQEESGRRERIRRMVLYGGNANVRGLPEHLARTLGVPCHIADLRAALVDSPDDIPPLERQESLRYATAVGLALRSGDLRLW